MEMETRLMGQYIDLKHFVARVREGVKCNEFIVVLDRNCVIIRFIILSHCSSKILTICFLKKKESAEVRVKTYE
jgi:hypothetical protein